VGEGRRGEDSIEGRLCTRLGELSICGSGSTTTGVAVWPPLVGVGVGGSRGSGLGLLYHMTYTHDEEPIQQQRDDGRFGNAHSVRGLVGSLVVVLLGFTSGAEPWAHHGERCKLVTPEQHSTTSCA
jgi:hypothetical protein